MQGKVKKRNDDKRRKAMRSQRTKNKTQKKGETEEGNSSITDCNQNSEVFSMDDTDEDIDTAGTEEEDWVEYMKRSTRQA